MTKKDEKLDVSYRGFLESVSNDTKNLEIKIPKKLTIVGQPWDVEIRDTWAENEVGDCDYSNCRIRIHDKLNDHCKLETLMHELIHACLGAAGIEHEEQFVTSLAPLLLDALIRNRARFC